VRQEEEQEEEDLGPIGADDVADESSTNGTLTAADSLPLLHGTVVAHAHVTALIQYRVDVLFEADDAFIVRVRFCLGTREELRLVRLLRMTRDQ
jgi:hypothetical protein